MGEPSAATLSIDRLWRAGLRATLSIDRLWRAGLRVAFRLQKLYWFLFRPEKQGVYVAV
jgi:hypothetical protein